MTILPMLLLVVGACAPKTVPGIQPLTPEEPVLARSEASAGVKDDVFAQLLEDHWSLMMFRSPFWATRLGDRRYDDALGSVSPESRAVELREDQALLARTQALSLQGTDEIIRRVFLAGLEADVAVAVCETQTWSFSPRSNPLGYFLGIAELHPVQTPEDGANLLARYDAMPAYVDGVIASLREGAAAGRFNNATTTELVLDMVDAQFRAPAQEQALLSPARVAHEDWTVEELTAFRAGLQLRVETRVTPALQRWYAVMKDEILPSARGDDQPGLASLPGGESCYAAQVRRFTTLPDRDAAFIHAQGLSQLESVHAEFRVLGATALGTGELSPLFTRLRTDPALRFETAEQVEATARAALARAEEAVLPAFGRLPDAACEVRRVPDYEAPYTTIAYYRRPVPDGSVPGAYYVNVHAPDTRPRHEAEVLAYHEAVPGHHLQIAIAQELPDTPAFLRHAGMTAYVEGWALYSERLADELGLYTTDIDRLGMLSYDAWRGARLAVDTGLHALGWSRQQAIDFMMENTPLAENNIVNEVDRYISTPGQALAYKTGQLEILRLRAEAEARLGSAFDLADFHDVVLGSGAVTLPILQELVEAWVQRVEKGPG